MMQGSKVEAKEAAVEELATLLPLPSSLNALNSIRSCYALQLPRPGTSLQSLNSIRSDYALQLEHNNAELSSSAVSQVEEAEGGIHILANSRQKVDALRDKFRLIDKLCEDFQTEIEHHDQITLLGNALINLNTTLRDVEAVMAISSEAAEARASLSDDLELVRNYEKLIALEWKIERFSTQRDEAGKLLKCVEDVVNTRAMFEQTLWAHISNFFQIARHSPQTLVQAVRVVETQEILDRTSEPKVGELRYKDRCYTEISKSIEARFDVLFRRFTFVEDLELVLEEASVIALELNDIFGYVAPCFPPQYEIFEYCVHLYMEHFIKMLHMLGERASELSNVDILKVTGWVAKFQEALIELGVENGLAAQCVESVVLDPLVDVYVDRMQLFLRKCLTNILEGDRRNPPKRRDDGRLDIPGGAELFHILREQIVQANSTDLMLYRITLANIQIVNEFQAAQRKIMLGKRAFDIGLERLCAMVNSSYKCHELALELSNNIMESLTPYYAEQISLGFGETCERFLSVGKEALWKAVKVIYEDPGVTDLLRELYQKDWYAGLTTESLTATFGDYFADVKVYVEESVYKRFAEVCLEGTVVVYVDRFLARNGHITQEDLERLKVDEEVLDEFFEEIIAPAKVQKCIEVLAQVRHLASADKVDTFIEVYETLLQSHPDCVPEVVEKIVLLRTDIPETDGQEVIVKCKALLAAKSEGGELPKLPGRVFSRLKSLSTYLERNMRKQSSLS